MTTAPVPAIPHATPRPAGVSTRALLGITGVIVAAIAGGALVLSLGEPAPSETAVATALAATATQIDESASAIIRDGEKLAANASVSRGTLREHSIGDAQRMIADGKDLQALAARLRDSAKQLGEAPLQRASVDVGLLRVKIAMLRTEGEETLAHGKAMVTHGAFMESLAREPNSGISPEDAAIMSSDSAFIVRAGEQTLRLAGMLEAATDRYERALGGLIR